VFIAWRALQSSDSTALGLSGTHVSTSGLAGSANEPPLLNRSNWHIARNVAFPKVLLQLLIDKHGTVDIVLAVTNYLHKWVPLCQVTPSAADFIDIYKQITIDVLSPQRLTDNTQTDVIWAIPTTHSTNKKHAEPD
jgi:hypothetical protein